MERLNSEGIPRDHLAYALKDGRAVIIARRIDSCMLCRRKHVNEAGLCQVCWTLLTDEELALANKWLMGVSP